MLLLLCVLYERLSEENFFVAKCIRKDAVNDFNAL